MKRVERTGHRRDWSAGWRGGLEDGGAGGVVDDEEGEALDAVELVGGQGGVVEAAAEIGVAVLVELDGAAAQQGVALDVGGGQRGAGRGPADLELAVRGADGDGEIVGEVGDGLATFRKMEGLVVKKL